VVGGRREFVVDREEESSFLSADAIEEASKRKGVQSVSIAADVAAASIARGSELIALSVGSAQRTKVASGEEKAGRTIANYANSPQADDAAAE